MKRCASVPVCGPRASSRPASTGPVTRRRPLIVRVHARRAVGIEDQRVRAVLHHDPLHFGAHAGALPGRFPAVGAIRPGHSVRERGPDRIGSPAGARPLDPHVRARDGSPGRDRGDHEAHRERLFERGEREVGRLDADPGALGRPAERTHTNKVGAGPVLPGKEREVRLEIDPEARRAPLAAQRQGHDLRDRRRPQDPKVRFDLRGGGAAVLQGEGLRPSPGPGGRWDSSTTSGVSGKGQ